MLISALELKDKLGDGNTVVFDCRFRLGQPDDGRTRYLNGHIPGAYHLDLEKDLSGPKDTHGGRHPLPSPEAFAAILRAAGVGSTSNVVVYDDGEGMATRAWWLIRYVGHDRCSVLDGGWSAWLGAEGPVEQTVPTSKAGNFSPSVRTDWVVGVSEVEEIASGRKSAILLDARGADRFRGDFEPIDPVAGHIPGALNAPWTDGITEEGRWKSAEAQRARFAGVDPKGEVVAYCGSGVTACANLFAMELAGIRGVKLYAGSFSDWCSYSSHNVEKGR